MVTVIGIDPGIEGAVAVLRDRLEIYDTPTEKPKTGKRDYDIPAMLELLCEINWKSNVGKRKDEEIFCYIEDVHSMPNDGHVGAFSFGRGVGIWHGLLVAAGIKMCRVLPQTWKRVFGLIGGNKDSSRYVAIDKFPEQGAMFKRKMDHNRAEAALIAEYGRLLNGRC